MRLFTAIEIPEEVRECLRAVVDRWKSLARINWSPVQNLHITTKFIGEWPEEKLDAMKHALHAIPTEGSFEISVHGLGWFPDERRPRVLWAGIDAGDALVTLARVTEEAVATLGVPVETRPYSPHLTLARIREAVPLDALRSAVAHVTSNQRREPLERDFGTFRATEFFLYLSAGGKYTRLAAFPLREKGDRPLSPPAGHAGKPETSKWGQSSLSPFSKSL